MFLVGPAGSGASEDVLSLFREGRFVKELDHDHCSLKMLLENKALVYTFVLPQNLLCV